MRIEFVFDLRTRRKRNVSFFFIGTKFFFNLYFLTRFSCFFFFFLLFACVTFRLRWRWGTVEFLVFFTFLEDIGGGWVIHIACVCVRYNYVYYGASANPHASASHRLRAVVERSVLITFFFRIFVSFFLAPRISVSIQHHHSHKIVSWKIHISLS